ncbi:MAG: hypothetical protein Q4D42_08530 [Eubacteriales bacterium]|nr:hypothetical protein [Eubacteriales bacterium]
MYNLGVKIERDKQTKTSPKEIRVATYRKGQEPRKEIAMNTTTSAVRFTIDFINTTIIGTQASFNKASKGFGPEYEELTAKIAAHPTFKLAVKEQKHKTARAKRTYEGLNDEFIQAYISTLDNAEEMQREYKAIQKAAKGCRMKAFPMTKKWFLDKFSTKEKPFKMDDAREKISNFRIAQATKPLTEISSDNAEQTRKAS